MIDLHCHIVPGVDDGAVSMDEACEMAFRAWHSGTKCIVATPHYNRPDRRGDSPIPKLKQQYKRLREKLEATGCPLEMKLGMEFFVTERMERDLNQGSFLPLGSSKYLLMECYFDEDYSVIRRAMDAVFDHGLVPVLAHPERYKVIQHEPWLVGELYEHGVVIQLNKGTIMGRMGTQSERTAWWILRNELAHVIASDAHGIKTRNPDLDEVRRMLVREISPAYAELLLEINPYRILYGRKK